MRAISYGRYSSHLQDEGHSIFAQLTANRNLIESRDWQLVGTYVDEAESGATTERRRLQRMLTHAKAGRCDVIVVHKLDRLTRSLIDLLLMIRELEQAGVKLVSAAEQFDFTSPIGRVVMVMLIALAEWFLANLRVETAKGKRARVAKGFSNASRTPFGYASRYEKDGHSGIPVPLESEAEVVRWMFREYATGTVSDRDLARQLNARGVKLRAFGRKAVTGWGQTSVSWILQNRYYIGQVVYHGDWHKGWHEPIISEELFLRCQEVRDDRRQRRPTARRTARIFALSGVARCNRCQGPMYGGDHTTKRGERRYEYRYYSCANLRVAGTCDAPYVRVDIVEEAVGARLQGVELVGDWREQLRVEQAAQAQEPDTSAAERARLEQQLANNLALFDMGDRSLETYVKRRDEITRELAKIRPPRTANLLLAGQLMEGIGQDWEDAEPEDRRKLARLLFSAVYLDAGHEEGPVVRIEYRPDIKKLLDLARVRELERNE